MLILNSSVEEINPVSTLVETAQAMALSSKVPYHPPWTVPMGLRVEKLGDPRKTTLPEVTSISL